LPDGRPFFFPPVRHGGLWSFFEGLKDLDFTAKELEDFTAKSLQIEPGTSRDYINNLGWTAFMRHVDNINRKIEEHNRQHGGR
jgi:hypothetical protein